MAIESFRVLKPRYKSRVVSIVPDYIVPHPPPVSPDYETVVFLIGGQTMILGGFRAVV